MKDIIELKKQIKEYEATHDVTTPEGWEGRERLCEALEEARHNYAYKQAQRDNTLTEGLNAMHNALIKAGKR